MDKLNALLDKLYTNQESMMYFYIVLGGVALLLIILIILTSFKIKRAKKNEASVKEIKEADAGISLIEPVVGTEAKEPEKVVTNTLDVAEAKDEVVVPVNTESAVADNIFDEVVNNDVNTNKSVETESNNDFVSNVNLFDEPVVSSVPDEEVKTDELPSVEAVSAVEEEVPVIEMPKPAEPKEVISAQEVASSNETEASNDRAKTISELLNSDDEPNVIKDAADEFGTKPVTNDLSDLKAKLDSMRRK